MAPDDSESRFPGPRVAVLGGGMAGLAAAWRLTRPGGPGARVTVYQRGWRLGGKGASSRGRHGRIEEHGLHVWPGFYDNAFRLIRDCYRELGRTDPGCPIRTWEEAFFRASTIGLAQGDDDWLALFPENDLVPGDGGDDEPDPLEIGRRALELLARFATSLGSPGTPTSRAVLSTSRRPPGRPAATEGLLASAMAALDDRARRHRVSAALEILLVMGRGALADRIAARGWSSINHLDFREWLAGHGASAAALDSPLILGMYDFVFGYEQGDRSRPRFAAGLAVQVAARLFYRYRGAIFWKMRAGMGDVVFAPLYEVLRRRGVRFEFFHRVDGLHLTPNGTSVAAVTLGRQLTLRPEISEYQPLVEIGGLPVFPDRPDPRQLHDLPGGLDDDLESCWNDWPDAARVHLEAGKDFDHVVFAISLGMVPRIGSELIERDPRWRDMVDHVGTVATQACQLWLRPDERSLGWTDRASVVTGCGPPFDTFASMSHTLAFEQWPDGEPPRTSASLCAVLPDSSLPAVGGRAHRELAAAGVRADVDLFLADGAAGLWPRGADASGRLRPGLLWSDGRRVGGVGRCADDGVYVRANTDPSDRYVQSLPGTDRYRLRADGSGLDNLVLAGDWIDCGLNAGCIEAAVIAGMQAANAVEGAPLTDGTTGYRPGGGGRVETARAEVAPA